MRRLSLVLLSAIAFILSACGDEGAKCTQGDMKCENNILMVCGYTDWGVKKNCAAAGKLCDAESQTCSGEAVFCVDGEKKCDGDSILLCVEKNWETEKLCDLKQTCDSETKLCVEKPETCIEGSKECDGTKLMTCSATGAWELEMNCADKHQICDSESFACVCDGATKWSEKANACVVNFDKFGICSVEEEGRLACDGVKKLQCKQEKWLHLSDCLPEEICVPESHKCSVVDCEGTEPSACVGSKLRICEAGKMVDTDCTMLGGVCEGGSCKYEACEETTFISSCEGNILSTCSSNSEKHVQDCSYYGNINVGSQGTCKETGAGAFACVYQCAGSDLDLLTKREKCLDASTLLRCTVMNNALSLVEEQCMNCAEDASGGVTCPTVGPAI